MKKSARSYQPSGGTYRVNSAKLELPRGSHFAALNIPVADGDLCLFELGGHLTIGRWTPNRAGLDWIIQPGRLIPIVGDVPVRILGKVLPVEMTARQIAASGAEDFTAIIRDDYARRIGQ